MVHILRNDETQAPRSVPSISRIMHATAYHYGIPLERMLSRRRSRSLARPRQVAMYLACNLTTASIPKIGRMFKRDHTTIMHGRDVIAARLGARDEDIAHAVGVITSVLALPEKGI